MTYHGTRDLDTEFSSEIGNYQFEVGLLGWSNIEPTAT
jgi:hypothetical protein